MAIATYDSLCIDAVDPDSIPWVAMKDPGGNEFRAFLGAGG